MTLTHGCVCVCTFLCEFVHVAVLQMTDVSFNSMEVRQIKIQGNYDDLF